MRVAVIGCGFQGRLHVECLSRLPGVSVVAVADTDAQRRVAVADDFGVPQRYASFRDLLAGDTYDLVTVCTMAVHHAEMTVAALEAGSHVLCEKPLAMNAAEGQRMVDTARRCNRHLAVGYNMRYTPNALALAGFVQSGQFGRPVYTRAWARASQVPWWGEHYRSEVSGGGALASTAVHFLDLALNFAGFPRPLTASASMTRLFPAKRGGTAPDATVAARFTAEDLITAHLRFDGGFWMTLEGSWIDNRPSVNGVASWDYSLDAIGEKAQFQFDPLTIRGETQAGEIVDLLPDSVRPDVAFPPSVAALIADVVDAIQAGRKPLPSGEQALEVQRVVDAIYRSAELGRETEV